MGAASECDLSKNYKFLEILSKELFIKIKSYSLLTVVVIVLYILVKVAFEEPCSLVVFRKDLHQKILIGQTLEGKNFLKWYPSIKDTATEKKIHKEFKRGEARLSNEPSVFFSHK